MTVCDVAGRGSETEVLVLGGSDIVDLRLPKPVIRLKKFEDFLRPLLSDNIDGLSEGDGDVLNVVAVGDLAICWWSLEEHDVGAVDCDRADFGAPSEATVVADIAESIFRR